MSKGFIPGARVRLIGDAASVPGCPLRTGDTGTLVRISTLASYYDPGSARQPYWEVAWDAHGETSWVASHDVLELIDDYDGHETTKWEECVWKPRQLQQA